MALADEADRRPLAGRGGELLAVAGLVQRAAHGEAGTLLVSGEAGVGKTALLREGCARHGGDADVLWASCLPLTAGAVPFLPLTSALREWAAQGVPAPAAAAALTAGGGPVQFDAWLDGACRRRPVVLVVDDLHWADRSSLDVLMYVIAGPARRRLAVAATIRAREAGPGHPLRPWLADVRRLPRVQELRLQRLDRPATQQQLTELLGAAPHQSLIDDVFVRTRGNPYLTTLLARGLPPDATRIPAVLPTDLREAVTRAWHGLSAPARELTRLLAVAGRPLPADRLGDVAAAVGMAAPVVPLLREAVDGVVVELGADDRYWFVHPLLAEVLEEELLPEERRDRHAAFAAVLTPPDGADPVGDLERTVDLAEHHHRAGHVAEAYRWALHGAHVAERAGGAAESLRLLHRALEFRPRMPHPAETRAELLRRIRDAAQRAGEHAHELAAVEELTAATDPDGRPLERAELLVRRMHLRFLTGREFFSVSDMREAVRLSAAYPGSPEHALATAELADAELWHGETAGAGRAGEALRLARACGSDRALTYALTATMLARGMAREAAGVQADAQESQDAAARAGDHFAFVHASLIGSNAVDGPASPEVVDSLRRSRERLTTMGAPHPYVAWLCAAEAQGLAPLGDWRGCVQRLRVALGAPPGPTGDVIARLTAAQLACWQGRLTEAYAHLARADELFAEQSAFRTHAFDAVRAQLAVATGDTDQALRAALDGARGDIPATMIERVMPLAARALADQAERLRDRGADVAPATTRLDDLRSRHPQVPADFSFGPVYQAQLRAMQALYDAEADRAHRRPGAAGAWEHAAEACRQAGLAWDEAYARWRLAQALLPERAARDAAVTALRRAHELAADLLAAPLLEQTVALARGARVSLTADVPRVPVSAAAVAGLTAREREILGHVAAGRTYREIARTLVVSEKTVSVHISNMLRKTGTANRVELAQLAHRLNTPPGDS